MNSSKTHTIFPGPGSDGVMDPKGHFVGMWCPLPDGTVLYGWVELTQEELELPVSTMEFVGSVWGLEAFGPHLRGYDGVVEYRAVIDSLAACLKSDLRIFLVLKRVFNTAAAVGVQLLL